MVLVYVEALFIVLKIFSSCHIFFYEVKKNFLAWAMKEKRHCPHIPLPESSSLSLAWAWQPMYPGAICTRPNRDPQRTGTRRCRVSCPPPTPPTHPLRPAPWNPNVCIFLCWQLGSRLWEQSPLELADSLRTQEKESKVEPGTKIHLTHRMLVQWSSSSEPWSILSVGFLWPLIPLNSCYRSNTTKSLELVTLGKPLRCQKKI